MRSAVPTARDETPKYTRGGDHQAARHRARQRDYHDHGVADPEFEITRPRGGGRFYSFLMEYKVRAAVGLLAEGLRGATVLDVCSGSGMDAELLSRLGAHVVCLDISTGALNRAAERSRRYGVAYGLVGGDVERLPMRDKAFDYAFVHDGLHHLMDPEGAISEMVRVSRRGAIITEPAEAMLTAILIKLHVLSPFEEAGNRVHRLHPRRLKPLFARLGFPLVRYRRYLVKYPHRPGRLFRLFDRPGLYELARFTFLVVGARLLGAAGNKLAIVALAQEEPDSR